MTSLTANPSGGYDGVFGIVGLDDACFPGIEHFIFSDLVGGNDTVFGGTGSDFVIAGAVDTRMRTGGGSDFVEIWFDGVKTITGGAGYDSVFVFFTELAPGEIQLKEPLKHLVMLA